MHSGVNTANARLQGKSTAKYRENDGRRLNNYSPLTLKYPPKTSTEISRIHRISASIKKLLLSLRLSFQSCMSLSSAILFTNLHLFPFIPSSLPPFFFSFHLILLIYDFYPCLERTLAAFT